MVDERPAPDRGKGLFVSRMVELDGDVQAKQLPLPKRYPTTTLSFGLANGATCKPTHSEDLHATAPNDAVLCTMKLVLGRATSWSNLALQLNLAATRIIETNNCHPRPREGRARDRRGLARFV